MKLKILKRNQKHLAIKLCKKTKIMLQNHQKILKLLNSKMNKKIISVN